MPLDGDALAVGAGAVRVVPVGWSDVEVSGVVHVAEQATVIAGDVAYNGMHMWLAGSTPQTRAGWLASLDAIEALPPRVVIAGHRNPDAPDDDPGRILDEHGVDQLHARTDVPLEEDGPDAGGDGVHRDPQRLRL